MAKYNKFERRTPKARYKIHPIWAGIGFLMVILVPVVAWAGASVAVEFGLKQGWPFLWGFSTYLQVPNMLYMIPGMYYLTTIANFPATATVFIFILIILSGVMSIGYAFVYRLIGPPRYSPQDVPAPRIKTAKYKR